MSRCYAQRLAPHSSPPAGPPRRDQLNLIGRHLNPGPRRDKNFGAGAYLFMDVGHDLVLPLRFNRAGVRLGGYNFNAVARLRPGVSIVAS
jgi:hypothetical protein